VLQFEVELETLDQFEAFRHGALDSHSKTGKWMKAFSKILLCPPVVELLGLIAYDVKGRESQHARAAREWRNARGLLLRLRLRRWPA
jgi:hypothetical protein